MTSRAFRPVRREGPDNPLCVGGVAGHARHTRTMIGEARAGMPIGDRRPFRCEMAVTARFLRCQMFGRLAAGDGIIVAGGTWALGRRMIEIHTVPIIRHMAVVAPIGGFDMLWRLAARH